MKISPINGLVFSSAAVGGMNSAHFDNFLAQARTSLDIKEEVIFAYDGVPAHWNLVIPAPDTEPKMFPPPPPHSPFLNIAELSESGNQGRISLKDAWIIEIRPEPEESHWGVSNTTTAWSSAQKHRHCERSLKYTMVLLNADLSANVFE